jgi:2'-5' RNA ligase
MRSLDQAAFDFIEELPWRPKKPECTFVAVVPDLAAAKAIERVARNVAAETQFTNPLLAPERYHLSLVHISDRDRIYSRDKFLVAQAARLIELSPFEVSLSQAGSFPCPPRRGGPPKHPLVLLADEGDILELFRSIGRELRKFGIKVGDNFTPHVTLAYGEQFIPMRSIEPIRFTVREFVLIHSERGRSKHNVLGTWTLR